MFTKFLILISLISVSLQVELSDADKKLPIGIIPGLEDFCGNPISMGYLEKEIQKRVDNKVFCINSGPFIASLLTSLESQIERGCRILHEQFDTINLKDGFILMGFSQGGLVARALLQKCDIGKYVKKLISYGGPHNGVAMIPGLTGHDPITNLVGKITDEVVYWPLIQGIVGPAGYFHRIDDESQYINSNIVLADLNNVHEKKNPEYKARVSALEAFVMIQFSEDIIIVPKESTHFGFYKNSSKTD